jgi:hypothetical protein
MDVARVAELAASIGAGRGEALAARQPSQDRVRHELTMLHPLFPLSKHVSLPPGLAWAEPLSAEELVEMTRELGAALLGAMLTDEWEEYDEALQAWRQTAEIIRDTDLTTNLLAERDVDLEIPLRRP